MHAQATSVLASPASVTATADVYRLDRTELSVAVYASDAPLRSRRELDDRAQLLAWAAQGLARLGEEQVWWMAWRSCQLGGRCDRWSQADLAEYEGIWPRQSRADLANDASYRIAPLGSDWPGKSPMRTVDLPGDWRVVISERNLEMARRFPARAAADSLLFLAVVAR